MNEHLSRLRSRSAPIAAGAVLSIAYWLVGGLALWMAIAGIAALLALAALWPDASPSSPGGGPPDVATAASATGVRTGSAASPTAAQWRAMLEGIPAPAILLGNAVVVTTANARARDIFGVEAGRHLSFAIRSPDLIAAMEVARGHGQGQVTSISFGVPVERSLHVTVTPVAAAPSGGGAPDLLLVFHDRTEEQQLAQLRADFVANASHELRTPLTSVKGFIETLQTSAKDDPKARERFLGIMLEQTSRMSRLIDDLLSLSRVEMREHLRPQDLVDLADVAQALALELEPVAKRADRRLTIDIAIRPALVLGDRDELAQVLQNLLQNAVKYGRAGGHVGISLAREGGRFALSVSDDGIGIAPEHVPRLTERFYRVNAPESRARGGTGLGLAIVKHIVNRHNGELKIASAVGKGSTFTVLLPAAETAAN
jgi:two-component system phosphate regulon sensor histidine kinase PhoR